MSKFRKSMPKKASKKNFTRNAVKVHPKNTKNLTPRRGGRRL